MAYTTACTTVQAVTRKLKIEGFQSLTFYGKTLALSNQVKYLGVILDSKLHEKTTLKQNVIKHWQLFIKYAVL